jgi:hypothetical protein
MTMAATTRLAILAVDSPYRIPLEKRTTLVTATPAATRRRITIVRPCTHLGSRRHNEGLVIN